jgi:hypothetical protein
MMANCKLSSGLRTAIQSELLSRPDAPADLPPGPVPAPEPAHCRRCGGKDLRVSWHEQQGGGRAVRADCGACGRFVAFLPQTPENVARADACRSPTGLLDVLVRAEGEGVELARHGPEVVAWPPGKASEELRSLLRQHQHQLQQHLGPRGG